MMTRRRFQFDSTFLCVQNNTPAGRAAILYQLNSVSQPYLFPNVQNQGFHEKERNAYCFGVALWRLLYVIGCVHL